jgi:hypothetical protein
MGSTKKHKIRESKKRKHRSRSNSPSPERTKHRHHKKHHKDRKKEKIIKDKNGELIPKYNYDSEGKLHLRLSRFYIVLRMVYSAQNYWVFGLFPSSVVFGSRNTTFRKLDLFP